jgi:hypothetical protein
MAEAALDQFLVSDSCYGRAMPRSDRVARENRHGEKGVPPGEDKEHVMTKAVKPPGSRAYFTHRESQERSMAEGAIDRAVRCAHLRMAERYAVLAREEIVVTRVGA